MQLVDKPRGARSRLSATFGGKASDKEAVRQCFLFSNHLLLTTRQSDDDGRLNLVPQIGKIPLSDAVLIEDPSDQSDVDDGSYLSTTNLKRSVSRLFSFVISSRYRFSIRLRINIKSFVRIKSIKGL